MQNTEAEHFDLIESDKMPLQAQIHIELNIVC